MNLRLCSDLHIDHREGRPGRTTDVVSRLGDGDHDVLVIAGDVAESGKCVRYLDAILAAQKHAQPVVFVAGNHEYYNIDSRDLRARLRDLQRKSPGRFYFLDKDVVEIKGQRFVGCTLWFPFEEPDLDTRFMNDFRYVPGLKGWVDREARDCARFLRREVRGGDVVVTHHMPHPRSISPKFAAAVTNKYFLNDVSDVVENHGAQLWHHGHTHDHVGYPSRDGRTYVVTWPLGYPGERWSNGQSRPDVPYFDMRIETD